MGVHSGRSQWAFTVGVHSRCWLLENLAGSEKWCTSQPKSKFRSMSSKRCGSERGAVDFVLYFMMFGESGGRRGRTDGAIKSSGLRVASQRMRISAA